MPKDKNINKNKQSETVNPKIKNIINQVFKEDHDLIDALKYL